MPLVTVTINYSSFKGCQMPVVEVLYFGTHHDPKAPPDLYRLRTDDNKVLEFYAFELDATAYIAAL